MIAGLTGTACALSFVVGAIGLDWLNDDDGGESHETLFHGWHIIRVEPPERYLSLDGAMYLLGGVEVTAGLARQEPARGCRTRRVSASSSPAGTSPRTASR